MDLKVVRVMNADRVREGDTIALYQEGGILPDGRLWVGSAEGYLPDIGTEWLFFLQDLHADGFNGPGFGRFEIVDGKVPPNGGEALPAIAAVTGFTYEEVSQYAYAEDGAAQLKTMARRTVDDVAITVQEVIAEAPLPSPYKPEPGKTAPPIEPVPTPH